MINFIKSGINYIFSIIYNIYYVGVYTASKTQCFFLGLLVTLISTLLLVTSNDPFILSFYSLSLLAYFLSVLIKADRDKNIFNKRINEINKCTSIYSDLISGLTNASYTVDSEEDFYNYQRELAFHIEETYKIYQQIPNNILSTEEIYQESYQAYKQKISQISQIIQELKPTYYHEVHSKN